MSFPQWPKGNKETVREPDLPEELFDLVGTGEREVIISAIERLKALCANLPKTSRSLSASSKEFVIPLESKEQKEQVVTALYDLGIFPWEEDGQLIVDHKRDLAKLRAAGFEEKPLMTVSVPAPETQETRTLPGDASFPMYYPQSLSDSMREKSVSMNAAKAAAARSFIPQEMPEDEPGIDTELNEIINLFDQGLIDADDEVFKNRIGFMPSLRLFPHAYLWDKGKVFDKRSGKEISKEERQTLLMEAKSGNEKAITALTRLHTGLVLKVVTRYVEKFSGDPDDLFQEGMIGLLHAINTYDEERGAFSTHAMICIEQRVRRSGYADKKPIRLPVHVGQQASELRRAKQSVASEGELRPEDVFENLPQHHLSRGGRTKRQIPVTGVGLDRLERLYYLNAAFDPVSIDEDNVIDKELLPHGVLEDSLKTNDEHVAHKELEYLLNKALLTLTPHAEHILRLRFGLSEPNIMERERILDIQGYLSGGAKDGLTLEEVGILFGVSGPRIRQLEAKALRALRHPSRSRALRSLLDS